jgi:hypothetical protein
MRLAAVIVVFMAVQATPSEASKSCMTGTEARQHFDSSQTSETSPCIIT